LIKNIPEIPDSIFNGLFRFCVFGQSGKIIPEIISLLESDDPAKRREALYILSEFTFLNESISRELSELDGERKAYTKKIEMDTRILFFDSPISSHQLMSMDEIERCEARMNPIDPNPIVEAIARSCDTEDNEAVKECAFTCMTIMTFNMDEDEALRTSLEQPRIIRLCVDALSDRNFLIRSEAIETLGYIGNRAHIPILSKLVDDPTIIPPPTPEEEEIQKEKTQDKKTIGEIAQKALTRLEKKVNAEEIRPKGEGKYRGSGE